MSAGQPPLTFPTSRTSPNAFRILSVPDDSPPLPTSRIARWVAIGAAIVFAVALYFRDGLHVQPLTNTPSTAPAAQTGQPAN